MTRLPKQEDSQFYTINRNEHEGILAKFSAVDATMPLAKITAGGADGSITVVAGIITAYVAPT